MSVGDFCNREVIVMGPGESAREAARLMREQHVGDVLVVEERGGRRYPLGIVTDRDLVIELLASDADPDDLRVGDVMTGELVTARADEDLLDVVQRMRNAGVRRMPVVEPDGALVGLMTLDDYINVFAEQMEELVRLISRERGREYAVRSKP